MGIKDKATYGEHYWSMQVEAEAAFDEEVEAALSPYFRGIFGDIPELSDLPAGLQTFIRALGEPPSAGLGGFLTSAAGEFASEIARDLTKPAMSGVVRAINRGTLETWLTSVQANTLLSRNKIDNSYWELITTSEGYEPIIGKQLYQSTMPYPSIPDLVLYSRYHGDAANIYPTVQKYFDIDAVDFPVWEWLGQQRLTLMQVQTLYHRGNISKPEFYNRLAEIGWQKDDRDFVDETGWLIPNAMLLVQADLMQQKSSDDIIKDISIADINPKYAQQYLDAILTKPASQDVIAYELRKDPSLSYLDTELRRIGIHDSYFPLYKELAQQIPPIADIITMAVREAFTPDIAAKFGQYEDFPQPLEEWAAKKGLSTEWAQRYWAAHWALPSPRQGFEMLHRGIITRGELDMLLRALDVMPFWRKKLTGIAYRRVTRVDIRRMYKAGILTVKDVYDMNISLGYTPRDAKAMTDFTVQWAMPKHASITRSDILTAYKSRMIDRTEASDLLADMGEAYFHREFMLKAVDYKKNLEITELQIKGIKNLYTTRAYDDNKSRDELLKLDLPADEVNLLMQQWYYEVKAITPRHWTTAQTLDFIKKELITPERGRQELTDIGYDTEHIEIYMKGIA